MDARRFRMAAWLAAAAICTLPAAATAHGPPTTHSHAEEHAAAALVGLVGYEVTRFGEARERLRRRLVHGEAG